MKTNSIFKALSKTRILAVLMLVMFACTYAWGATGAITANKVIILPAGNTTNYGSAYWNAAGAPAYATSNDDVKTMTVNGSSVGTLRFYHAGYDGSGVQLEKANGYLETVITSTEGVDVEVRMCSNGGSGTVTAALTGASNQTVTGTTMGTKSLSTTSTSATLKITCATNAAHVGYIKITPKAKYTVTFYNAYGASTPSAVTQTTGGGSVTLPSASPTADCVDDGWVFAGWKKTNYQTSEVAYLDGLIPAGTYYPEGAENLYAVYKKANGKAKTDYTCVSTAGTTDKYTTSVLTGGYTITLSKNTSNSWYASDAPWRLYADGTQLSVSGSNPIDSLELVHNSTNYASFTSSIGGAKITMASSSGGTTKISSINSNSITLTSGGSGQNRISSITIRYFAYIYKSNPVCTFDYFVDNMHGNATTTQEGTYSMPAALSDATPGDDYCAETHYHFVGWLSEAYVNADGTLKSGYESYLYAPGHSGHTANNTTYYAIWAE